MRVTFVTPAFDLSGGQRAIAMYAHRLRLRGHRVLVVAPPFPAPTLHQTARAVLKTGRWPTRPSRSHVQALGVPTRTLERPRPVRAADVPDADVVIATWWETAEWVMNLPASKGVKLHYMQDYEIWGGDRGRVDAACSLPMPKVVIAGWVRDLLRDRFGIRCLALVPCSVDHSVFHAPPRGKQSKPTVGLNYTTFRNKGTDVSLAAVELARRQMPDLQLLAFGSTRPEPELPLPAGCQFHHNVSDDELRRIYSRCDAWLFGTRVEGFGLPILEAMACRTPVVGTPAGAAPELLAGGGGCLVRPEDPADMAAAIVRVCGQSDAAWRAMSDAAHETATRYTWEDAADVFERALFEAIANSREARGDSGLQIAGGEGNG